MTCRCRLSPCSPTCCPLAPLQSHPEYERDLAVQEIMVLAAVCDHPNVVDLLEVWEDAEYVYIVMVGELLGVRARVLLRVDVLGAGAGWRRRWSC